MKRTVITQLTEDVFRLDEARVYEVPSRSTDEVRLVIEHGASYFCTCPATVARCHHVKQVLESLKEEEEACS